VTVPRFPECVSVWLQMLKKPLLTESRQYPIFHHTRHFTKYGLELHIEDEVSDRGLKFPEWKRFGYNLAKNQQNNSISKPIDR
jgi:hypothetical protein